MQRGGPTSIHIVGIGVGIKQLSSGSLVSTRVSRVGGTSATWIAGAAGAAKRDRKRSISSFDRHHRHSRGGSERIEGDVCFEGGAGVESKTIRWAPIPTPSVLAPSRTPFISNHVQPRAPATWTPAARTRCMSMRGYSTSALAFKEEEQEHEVHHTHDHEHPHHPAHPQPTATPSSSSSHTPHPHPNTQANANDLSSSAVNLPNTSDSASSSFSASSTSSAPIEQSIPTSDTTSSPQHGGPSENENGVTPPQRRYQQQQRWEELRTSMRSQTNQTFLDLLRHRPATIGATSTGGLNAKTEGQIVDLNKRGQFEELVNLLEGNAEENDWFVLRGKVGLVVKESGGNEGRSGLNPRQGQEKDRDGDVEVESELEVKREREREVEMEKKNLVVLRMRILQLLVTLRTGNVKKAYGFGLEGLKIPPPLMAVPPVPTPTPASISISRLIDGNEAIFMRFVGELMERLRMEAGEEASEKRWDLIGAGWERMSLAAFEGSKGKGKGRAEEGLKVKEEIMALCGEVKDPVAWLEARRAGSLGSPQSVGRSPRNREVELKRIGRWVDALIACALASREWDRAMRIHRWTLDKEDLGMAGRTVGFLERSLEGGSDRFWTVYQQVQRAETQREQKQKMQGNMADWHPRDVRRVVEMLVKVRRMAAAEKLFWTRKGEKNWCWKNGNLILEGYIIGRAMDDAERFAKKVWLREAEVGFRSGVSNVGKHAVVKAMVEGYVKVGDEVKVEAWLDLGGQVGLDEVVGVNAKWGMYLREKDVRCMKGLVRGMTGAKALPHAEWLRQAVQLLAERNELDSANEILTVMDKEQMKIPPILISVVMNAAAEIGDWKAIADRYERLDDVTKGDVRIVNVVLKALVLLGSPYVHVKALFEKTFSETSGVKADGRAWAMIIQAACDADDMQEAYALLDGMRDQGVALNPYVLSIFVNTHLRRKEMDKARSILNNMAASGLPLTSISYALVIKSLLEGNNVPLNEIHAFVDNLLVDQPWKTTKSLNRGNDLENILTPIVLDAAKRKDIPCAEKYFYTLVQDYYKPSIPFLTLLLDTYRRVGDVHKMRKLWEFIFKIGCRRRPQAGPADQPSALLCIPLSIHLEGLSDACLHEEVMATWRACAANGFGFDASNWNHLCVALVRAGRPEQAFQVIEEVLLVKAKEIHSREVRALRPPKALGEGQTAFQLEEGLDGTFQEDLGQRPPNRRHQYRFDESQEGQAGATDPTNLDIIKLLRYWRPADITWRPTFLTIAVLDRAYSQIQNGIPVIALLGEEEDAEPNGEEGEGGAGEIDGLEKKKESETSVSMLPLAILGRINRKYAKTVGLIMLHRRKRRAQMVRERRTSDGASR